MGEAPCTEEPPRSAAKQMGGGLHRIGGPAYKDTGAPEGAPAQPAITRECWHKKSACNHDGGAVAPCTVRAAKPDR